MASHSSASAREQAPHPTKLTRTNTIMNALRQRAQAILDDRSVDPQTRAIIRYALEINDPWLARLVRSAEAGECVSDTFEVNSVEEKIEALAELICCADDRSAAALFVLMGTLENSVHAKALANTVKHFAFAHCADSNLYGIVDAQLSVVESELFA